MSEELRTSCFIPRAQESIAEDVEADGEERDSQEVHVRMPGRENHGIVRPSYYCGSNELGCYC